MKNLKLNLVFAMFITLLTVSCSQESVEPEILAVGNELENTSWDVYRTDNISERYLYILTFKNGNYSADWGDDIERGAYSYKEGVLTITKEFTLTWEGKNKFKLVRKLDKNKYSCYRR